MNRAQTAWLILIEGKQVIVGLLTEVGRVLIAQERDWDGINQEDLLTAIDAGRGDCLSSRGEKEGPSGVIFVLPSSWIDSQGEILPSYKEKLKFVSQHLSFTPLGFLVKDEVLSRWGKKEGEFSQSEFFNYLAQLVSEQEEEKKEEEDNQELMSEEKLDFGFREEDVAETTTVPLIEKKKELSASEPEIVTEKNEEKEEPKNRQFFLKIWALNLRNKLASFSFPKISVPRRGLFLLFPLILLALCFLVWYFSQVTVELYLTPEKITAEIQAKLDPEAKEIDIKKGVIPVETVTVVLEGEKTGATTGEKLVGEKAKGEVTIYNRTSKTQVFEAGTVLEGPGGLKFVLDTEVKVASKTPDLVSGVDRWGEAKAAVTAAEIGAEYNLAAESVFTISGFSKDEFLAKNQAAFTGGTSRKIRAVSKEDQENLKKSLLEELASSAREKLQSQAIEGKIIFESLQTEVVEEKYSAEIGDEEEELSLDLKVKATAAKLSPDRLNRLAEEILSQEVKKGLFLEPATIATELNSVKVDEEGIISGNLILAGKAYPQINREEVTRQLIRKRAKKAGEIIRSYPRVYRYQIHFQPKIVSLFSFLPPKMENIKIEIKE